MSVIRNAQLDWNESGTPISNQFDDVYFSNANGLEESRYVFIQQNHLTTRWDTFKKSRFVIAETGFGTGLNFLAVWHAFKQFRQQTPDAALTQLHFISFEKYPVNIDDLIKAHHAWPELADLAKELQQHYPIAVPECHRLVLADGMITLDLWFGDIHDSLPKIAQNEEGLVDAWFLDGFAPSKNQDMWNDALFSGMAKLTKSQGTCATFTAAGFVRRGLIDAGFDMKKVKGFGTKREMIAGTLTQKIAQTNIAPWFQRVPSSHISTEDNIAIIGGGIASATLALALHRRGVNVTLYCEDNTPALGASGNRQGALYPLIAEPEAPLNRFFAPAFLFARQLVKQASQQLEFDHDFCGVTQLAWNDKAKSKLDKMLLNQYPERLLQSLNAEETSETLGLEVDVDSIYYPLGGWLCPQQLTQALIYELDRQPNFDARFETKIKSLVFNTEDESWNLTSGDQSFHHGCVVVANGHQFSRFEQLQPIAATSVKGQVSHIPTTDTLAKLNTVLCYDGYMTPQNTNNGHHCIGASYDRSHIDHEFDPDAQLSNGERLKNCIPNQRWPNDVDTSGNQSRQGIRSVTRDHLPFVGNVCQFEPVVQGYAELDPQILRKRSDLMPDVPIYPNLFCMVGLGARGLCSAPLLAETLASQIVGDPLPLPIEVLEKIHPARMWVRKMLKGRPINEKS
ncbi:bifunctional tRNA (5-methylaminomethyl-2-thiouridine)(34)-methyltransferase MnmD/FAD-dependent 5-carboxymethylaminomethyl-2-thiouridine(34) oxidoreductase MnmC [Vibrio rumoiensis]|uniref:tRNA 5-methylaminomethyl-2-thiouridine biosynthesis bifunctional protein MnmC n=1 Tax=Vibrio rumoiensis 1S-45 TaxID=1188252 RepID=A0A1E5E090_9VIBR|nr:bifunctional tRNA (5-methylaminomethyl-2-thiouridine)(34)-methyltransferase MnmD/FAD-dependent 5-carboxymethylaminomethyl-2-thiouridine(34) oxidoreductase MnmC [Vibrio rumoiensis]OEF23708.1 bifunctional tRNA (5-methylaminomethyl-2-thiouridylate)-methyltransferase MnmD/FAD-dependent cmnm(5)s(2)U34 oxidoreductase MnmC [Vibrio rumoiensis 1S-45]